MGRDIQKGCPLQLLQPSAGALSSEDDVKSTPAKPVAFNVGWISGYFHIKALIEHIKMTIPLSPSLMRLNSNRFLKAIPPISEFSH